MMLDDHRSDEGFAGYDWYRTAARLTSLAQRIPAPVARLGARTIGLAAGWTEPSSIARFGRGLELLGQSCSASLFARLRSFISPAEVKCLYAGELLDRHRAEEAPINLVRRAHARAAGSQLRKMRYADIETYLADNLMPKTDVASMAHGLEVRAPLLDQEVLQFGLSLPDDYLMDRDGGKRILRDLLFSYLPRALFQRPKQGFSVPLSRWFAGELRPRMERLADSERLHELRLLQHDGIRKLLAEQFAGRRDNSQRLFNLLMLDEWLAMA